MVILFWWLIIQRTYDHAEGVLALKEKRRPKFIGN